MEFSFSAVYVAIAMVMGFKILEAVLDIGKRLWERS